MKIGLYTLTSPLHDEAAVNAASMEILSFLNQKGRVRVKPTFAALRLYLILRTNQSAGTISLNHQSVTPM